MQLQSVSPSPANDTPTTVAVFASVNGHAQAQVQTSRPARKAA
jgi:hypothetical protein